MTDGAARRAIEAVWRIESARPIGGLVRMVRDVDLAEDLAKEALVTALERWLRRRKMLGRKHDAIEHDASAGPLLPPDIETAIDENVGDDLIAVDPHLPPSGPLDRSSRRAHGGPGFARPGAGHGIR
jgi:hypothetical protein